MSKENIDKDKLDNQKEHWDSMFSEYEMMFGDEESEPARDSHDIFKKEGTKKILELGGGQGRDTLFFAEKGYDVDMLDYSSIGVSELTQRSDKLGLSENLNIAVHDLRKPLPFEDNTFDACYSHMLFCMALTTDELKFLSSEICRVLKSGGLHIYTARTKEDAHYGKGIHRGEDMYEMGGFVVHFFDTDTVKSLSDGFEIIDIKEFEEGELPRKLYEVIMRKI